MEAHLPQRWPTLSLGGFMFLFALGLAFGWLLLSAIAIHIWLTTTDDTEE